MATYKEWKEWFDGKYKRWGYTGLLREQYHVDGYDYENFDSIPAEVKKKSKERYDEKHDPDPLCPTTPEESETCGIILCGGVLCLVFPPAGAIFCGYHAYKKGCGDSADKNVSTSTTSQVNYQQFTDHQPMASYPPQQSYYYSQQPQSQQFQSHQYGGYYPPQQGGYVPPSGQHTGQYNGMNYTGGAHYVDEY